jgi:AcrR family transcriptional regulator
MNGAVDTDIRRPGRPRSAACDHAILEAALLEYAERGFEGMSVDAVAARAGVSKATIYRRYPSKLELVIAAAYQASDENAPKPDTGSLRGDLRAALGSLCALMNQETLGCVVRMVIADAVRHPDFARLHAEFVRSRRRGTIAALERAIGRGELRPDVDVEVAADFVVAPLFYRHLVSRMPLDSAYVDEVIDAFLGAFCH